MVNTFGYVVEMLLQCFYTATIIIHPNYRCLLGIDKRRVSDLFTGMVCEIQRAHICAWVQQKPHRRMEVPYDEEIFGNGLSQETCLVRRFVIRRKPSYQRWR